MKLYVKKRIIDSTKKFTYIHILNSIIVYTKINGKLFSLKILGIVVYKNLVLYQDYLYTNLKKDFLEFSNTVVFNTNKTDTLLEIFSSNLNVLQNNVKQDLNILQNIVNQDLSILKENVVKYDSNLSELKKLSWNIVSNIYSSKYHVFFKKFYGINRYKDVYLFASGPSLNIFNFENKSSNSVFVGVNATCLLPKLDLDYLFVQDNFKEKMSLFNLYKKGKCIKFYGIVPNHNAGLRIKDSSNLTRIPLEDAEEAEAYRYILTESDTAYWSNDISCEPIRDFGGTAISAMQFILYTLPKRIYLVGCDCSANGHFYDTQKDQHDDTPVYLVDFWKELKKYASYAFPNTEIISINPVNLKGIFKDEFR